METFYNKQKNQYIFATLRCGTNFLNSKPVRKLGWKAAKQNAHNLTPDHRASIIKVVRDPVDRWRSWFENFALDSDRDKWTLAYTVHWLKNFERTFSEDFHTAQQHIVYNSIKSTNCQTVYVRSEDLTLMIGLTDVPYKGNLHKNFYKLPQEIQYILLFQVRKIYQDDITWIKTLPIANF